MHRLRALGAVLLVAWSTFGPAADRPAAAAELGAIDIDASLIAFLDGKPLSLKLVGNHYCDDFSYPIIQCWSKPTAIEARAALSLLGGADYVTIYEQQGFNGTYMNVSQDYATLITIGWNDKVSSFKARNSETGRFTVDWFFGGANWSFCCNSQVSTLNAYDNTFSSVQRT